LLLYVSSAKGPIVGLRVTPSTTLRKLLEEIGKDHFYLMHLSWGGKRTKSLWTFASENNLIGLDLYGPVNVNQKWQDLPDAKKSG
jgi:hypothetical protein